MARPPWAILVMVCMDAVAGAAGAASGAWWAVAAVTAILEPGGLWRELGLLALPFGLAGVAVGCGLFWVGIALWRGSAWARWPSLLLAIGLVPAAVLFTVWANQGALLALVLVGPILAVGLFLPASRRFVGTAPAEQGQE